MTTTVGKNAGSVRVEHLAAEIVVTEKIGVECRHGLSELGHLGAAGNNWWIRTVNTNGDGFVGR